MYLAVVNLDKTEDFEQPFLVEPEGGKAFGHGLGIGLGVIELEHFIRARGPGVAPGLHEAAQFASSAAVGLQHGGFVQLLGQHHCRTRHKVGPHLVNFLEADGDAAARGKGFDAQPLAVNPDAVPGFAAQLVHGVGIVERIGYATVFLEVQTAGNLVFHKIDAFRGAQVIEGLLVAGQLASGAGVGVAELEGAFFFEKHEGLAVLVHSHQMRRQALVVQRGLPFRRICGMGGQGAQKRRHEAHKPAHGKNRNYAQMPERSPSDRAPAHRAGRLSEQGPPVRRG